MKCLSSNSLSEAMLKCHSNSQYHTLIYFISSSSKMEFLNDLSLLYYCGTKNNQFPGVVDISTHGLISKLIFDNGSTIDMISVENYGLTVNTHRYHMVLLEDAIYRSIEIGMFSTIASTTVIPYKAVDELARWEENTVDKNDGLDNFLNSFKIVN